MIINSGINNSLVIDTALNECSIQLPYGSGNREEVVGKEFFVRFKANGRDSYYLLKNLKFSYGNNKFGIYYTKNLKDNLHELDIQSIRDTKIKMITQNG